MEAIKENKTSKVRTNSNGKNPFFTGDAFQEKLKISRPNDPQEKESEKMAGQVMGTVHENKKTEPSSHFATELKTTNGMGSTLSPQTKSQMESAFGSDFSGIKIHSDEQSSRLGREINAKAFTVGSDIYFQKKYFNPKDGVGKRLLAHELAHTMQPNASSGFSVKREVEEQKDKADDKPKVETKVEVATEYKEGEIKGKTTTTRSGEEKVTDAITAKASEKTSGDTVSTSAELVAKDKASGISATTGIKAEETPLDLSKPDKAKAYFKVNGSWTLFDSKLKLDSGVTAETDFKNSPSLSVDGKAVFFPYSRLTPEIAGKFLLDKNGPSGNITPGVSLKITDMLSAKAGVPIDIGSNGKVKAGIGLGLVFKF
ncbi:DUF4157 domain-containing protein [Aquiflexum sp. TKW24L]|uniref:eCIS core domain-containing protein n=1 Tax=Aquiflexum sp. TKW24L TaxID=2942212 RepID=UPI0020BD4944|nr:DUF4157 domain-containing protein [Aquiflexum sp. TKW24L]MCL6258865.1 DUF4157 domain-containing protein [Aquiflexum sp. TKW24L]